MITCAKRKADTCAVSFWSAASTSDRRTGASCRERNAKPSWTITAARSALSIVAQNASSQSGLSPDLLKKMLPMLAMLVAGYMAKQRGAGAGATTTQASPSGGRLGGLLGGLLGGGGSSSSGTAGGLASMLDMDRDGNPLDDILRMATGKGSR